MAPASFLRSTNSSMWSFFSSAMASMGPRGVSSQSIAEPDSLARLLWRFAELAGEGFAEAGAGFKAGVELGGDHGVTFLDRVERMAQAPGAGVLREAHVEAALELAAGGGGLDAHARAGRPRSSGGGIFLDKRASSLSSRTPGASGSSSGRQRLQGRKPASSASSGEP